MSSPIIHENDRQRQAERQLLYGIRSFPIGWTDWKEILEPEEREPMAAIRGVGTLDVPVSLEEGLGDLHSKFCGLSCQIQSVKHRLGLPELHQGIGSDTLEVQKYSVIAPGLIGHLIHSVETLALLIDVATEDLRIIERELGGLSVSNAELDPIPGSAAFAQQRR